MGNAAWELYCLEHGIYPDGQMPTDDTIGKVPVFYRLMKKFKSQNFYQNFLSWFSTNLDEFDQDWSK